MASESETGLLQSSLALAVPMWIERIRPNLDEHLKDKDRLVDVIASKGDIILYKSKKKGETAAAFNDLAKALAILSFMPGGVKFLGLTFESIQEKT